MRTAGPKLPRIIRIPTPPSLPVTDRGVEAADRSGQLYGASKKKKS